MMVNVNLNSKLYEIVIVDVDSWLLGYLPYYIVEMGSPFIGFLTGTVTF